MQISFSLDKQPHSPELLTLADAEIQLFPQFLEPPTADHYFQLLHSDTPWQHDELIFAGKKVPIPRLQAWYGDRKSRYGYSGLSLTPLPWTDALQGLREQIQEALDRPFNSVLLNYYRNGQDSVAWHSDDERELGTNSVIASLSLGCERRFELKHRHKKLPKSFCDLPHGSLLVMGPGVQQNWQHRIPKQPGITGGRINLTFRFINC